MEMAAMGGAVTAVESGSGLLPRPSQEENASSGDSIFPQEDPAQG